MYVFLHHGVESETEESEAQLHVALDRAKHEVVANKCKEDCSEETSIRLLDILQ